MDVGSLRNLSAQLIVNLVILSSKKSLLDVLPTNKIVPFSVAIFLYGISGPFSVCPASEGESDNWPKYLFCTKYHV